MDLAIGAVQTDVHRRIVAVHINGAADGLEVEVEVGAGCLGLRVRPDLTPHRHPLSKTQ
jgi:hypothetical protein